MSKASRILLPPLAYIPVGNEVINHIKRIGTVHGVAYTDVGKEREQER